MQLLNSKEELLALINDGAIVITPNKRLSNQLQYDFYCYKQATIQIKPMIFPYQDYLHYLFRQVETLTPFESHPLLLSHQQQLQLWRQIIRSSQHEFNHSLIHAIDEAWERCQLWQLTMDYQCYQQTPQTSQFYNWQKLFQQRLKELGAITEEQLLPYLINYNSELIANTTQIWACFDNFTPQQQWLHRKVEEFRTPIYCYDLATTPNTAQVYPAKNEHDEIMQVIYWLQTRIAANDHSIALVIPDLQTQGKRLKRLIQRYLPEQSINISLGKPLIDYPLVSHAVSFLRLSQGLITNHTARFLLSSPYLAGSRTEFNPRSELLQASDLLQESMLSVQSFISECALHAPILSQRLACISPYPNHATPLEWVDLFKMRLQQLGFPGDHNLQSATYQCYQRFMGMFDELLPLGLLEPILSQQEALDNIFNLATSIIFQERTISSKIHILGMLEASGCSFDSLWLCGLSDQCLPQKTQFSPFIPISLQQEQAMPHASADRQVQFAQQLLQRLQDGSRYTVFSYAMMIEDTPSLPSPLLSNFREYSNLPSTQKNLIQLTHYEDIYQLPLSNREELSGGTSLLANQAKCPFRAFAAHRLHAKAPKLQHDGLSVSERGQIIHQILHRFWSKINSQQQLLALNDNDLLHSVEQAIQQTLNPLIAQQRLSFPPIVQEIERNRLKRLVLSCLLWEKQRSPFVVAHLEQEFILTIADLTFKVRVDRIDRVGGSSWIIDYKSSLPTPLPWLQERPEEPQLLLYSLLDDNIHALIFLQLKNGRVASKGISKDKEELEGIAALPSEEEWSNQQRTWSLQLEQLSNELVLGHCPPTPNRTTICQKCEFIPLCRINFA
ncbi:MAG: PD-(D/E)XK nuclease family protein [Legionella sp.]